MCGPITKSALLRNAGDALRKGSAGSTAGHAKTKDTAEVVQGLQKTKLCKFFLSGRCRRGQACTFAHGEEALQPQPDLSKTQFCFQYLKTGLCSYGESCSFAHSMEELRSAAPGAASKGGPSMTSNDDAFDFDSNLAFFQDEVEQLRTQLDTCKDQESANSVSTDARSDNGNGFCAQVAGAHPSFGSCQDVPFLAPAPMQAGASMAPQMFVPMGAVMQVSSEQTAPMAAVGAGSVLQCGWSYAPLCSAWSRPMMDSRSSSGSFSYNLSDDDDCWTSAGSIYGEQEGADIDAEQEEEEQEVDAIFVVSKTFLSLEPVCNSKTNAASSRARTASAPPTCRRI